MKPAKILIVEDERVVALSLEDHLKSIGHDVCGIAGSGRQAMSIAASEQPDVVLMDIKIKGAMDGIRTAEKLKQDLAIPVVFLTAFSDQAILERAKKAEPLGYIIKPFKPQEITAVVETSLYKAEMEKKLRLLNDELELKVIERTKDLLEEIELRKKAEKDLKLKTDYLQKANQALNAALENRDAEKRAIEEGFYLKLKKHLLPHIEPIKTAIKDKEIILEIENLQTIIETLLMPSSEKRFAFYSRLTPQEARISDLIKRGKSTKEIALALNISAGSVSTYRNHIRRKTGLLNSNQNLSIFLNSLDT